MQQADFSIGIDLGGTSTRVGLFDKNIELKASRTMVTRVADGPSAAVLDMANAIAAVRIEVGLQDTPCVGIGSPGPIDLQKGILGFLPNLPGWENFPLRGELARAARTVVVLESDANAAALAEWKLGAGSTPRLEHMAMITLGTGVGSGLILHGRIWHGMFGMAGEIGHATVCPEGMRCSCGSRGCLELYASAGAVVRFFLSSAQQSPSLERDLPAVPHSARSIAMLANQGDACALSAYRQMGHFLGLGISNLINTLDLPLIVVGGGVVEAWDFFRESMLQAAADYSVVYRLAHAPSDTSGRVRGVSILPASLGPSAGLIGAALLPTLADPRNSSLFPTV